MARPHFALLATAVVLLLTVLGCGPRGIVYPKATVEPVTEMLHGVKITDNYRWLEDVESPEVRRWIAAQNELTLPLIRRFPERQQILERLRELYDVRSLVHPEPYGDRYFYWQRRPGQSHRVLYMATGSWGAEPKVILDPNTWSEDGSVSCGFDHMSRDGTLIAYGKVSCGNEMATLYVINTDTDEHLPDVIPFTRGSSVAWLPDNSGFYYTRFPDPADVPEGDEHYYKWMYFHELGTDWHDDPLIWGSDQPKEYLCWMVVAEDERHAFIYGTIDWIKTNVHMLDLQDPAREIKPLVVGLDGNFFFRVVDGTLYFETTWQAPNRCVYRCPLDDPRQENWEVVIPEPEGVLLDWEIINRQHVVHVMENAYSRLFIYTLDGELIREIELPVPGSAGGIRGKWDGTEMFFGFSSFAYPPTVFRYDMVAATPEVIDRLDVDVDVDQYETKQVWYTSKDGTRVPMFITNRKGLVLDGNNPVKLGGYGGFNISIRPGFGASRFPWFDAGGVLAVPCLRGGGEFGREWHKAGRRENKQNVFDDFYAAAEYLIAEGYTNRDRLGIAGGSNGGLLVAAALTQRPELFRCVSCGAPLTDMLRYHELTIGKVWAGEYGTAEDPEQFEYLRAYSPYHNVQSGTRYPAVRITTGASDTRVHPSHALKMAAALQAATASDPNERPILLHVQEKTGHGGGRPLDMSLNLMADDTIWFMWQLGIIEPPKD